MEHALRASARTAGVGRRIATNSAKLLAAQGAGLAAQVASVLIVAHALGPAGLGQFSFISIAVIVAWTVVEFGMDTLVVLDAVRAGRPRPQLFSEAVTARLPLALLGILFLSLMPIPLQGATVETTVALQIASLSLIISTVAGAAEAMIRSVERMGVVAATRLVGGVLRVIGVVLALQLGAGIVGLAVVMVIQRIAEAGCYLLVMRRLGLPLADLARPGDLRMIPARLRRALPFAVLGMCGIVQLHADVFVIGAALGDQSVGLYRAAKGILDTSRFLPNAVFGALYPAIARLQFSGQGARLQRTFLVQTIVAVEFIALAAALTMSVGSGPLIALLYGDQFQSSAPVLQIAVWTLGPLVVNTLLGAHFLAAGRFWRVAAINAGGAAVTVSLNLALVPAFGLPGAAIATLASELSITIFYGIAMVIQLRAANAPRSLDLRRVTGPLAALRYFRLFVTSFAGGLAVAGTLWFLVLPAALGRYAARESLAGRIDGQSLSLLSISLTVGLFVLLRLVDRSPRCCDGSLHVSGADALLHDARAHQFPERAGRPRSQDGGVAPGAAEPSSTSQDDAVHGARASAPNKRARASRPLWGPMASRFFHIVALVARSVRSLLGVRLSGAVARVAWPVLHVSKASPFPAGRGGEPHPIPQPLPPSAGSAQALSVATARERGAGSAPLRRDGEGAGGEVAPRENSASGQGRR